MRNEGFVWQLLNRCAETEESTVAFSLYDGSQITNITYRHFREDIRKSTGYFIHKNIKGQHIAIAAENSYDWLVVFFGITGSGNVAVLLNQDLPTDVLRQQSEQADVSIICGNASRTPDIKKLPSTAFLDFEEICAGQAIAMDMQHCTDSEDTMAMMFTSGTTGKSKIVAFSNRNFQASMENAESDLRAPTICRMLLTFPLYHISGLVATTTYLQLSKTVCIGRGMRYVLADISKLNPTFIPMVPSVLGSIVKLLNGAKTEEQRRRILGNNLTSIAIGGSSTEQSLSRYIMDLGISIETAYGMTETAGATTRCVWNKDNIGSIGKPYGTTQCRIENGELLLKGPSIMKGYYKDPEATAAIIQDGWLHTGDLAYCDENGYYYLTGRKKNVIILANGENVNPEEIEEKLSECPDILESLVYSDGKKICADIYTNDGLAAADFVRRYNDNVPLYRQIHNVNYTSTPLEKTGSGKIKRKEAAHESQGN